ncbi:hypothetical protein ACFLZX_05495 [Nanoarchaeota archaeon]
MVPLLEETTNQAWEEQQKGNFSLPPHLEDKPNIKYWIGRIRRSITEPPYVVTEEEYSREGIKRKFRINMRVLDELIRQRVFRLSDPEADTSPIANLSIAQFISCIYDIDIEHAFVHEGFFSSKDLKKMDPEDRLDLVLDSYVGTKRFEEFIQRQQKKSRLHLKPVLDKPVNRKKLKDLGIISNPNDFEWLYEKGFLVETKSGYEAQAVMRLASFLPFKKSAGNYDRSCIGEIAFIFAVERLFPYCRENGLNPLGQYDIGESSKILGLDKGTLINKIDNGNLLGIKKKQRKLYGVDLVIYSLKETFRDEMTPREVEDLTGCRPIYAGDIGSNPVEGDYSVKHDIIPFFNAVALSARESAVKRGILELEECSVPYNRSYVTITKDAQRRYCLSSRNYRFGKEEIDFIKDELTEAGKPNKNGRIESNRMIFWKTGKNITVFMHRSS